MNSSFNVSPTSSEINRSSNLTDVPSILSERLNAPNVVQSAYQRSLNSAYLLVTSNSSTMTVPGPQGQGVQQQNSSPSSPPSSHEMNVLKQHSPNVTINSSLNARNPTTSSPSQMNYQMVHSPNVTINSSLNARNPSTPSPSSQMYNHVHSPSFANNSPSSSSTGFSDLPPLTTSLQSLIPPLSSCYTTPFEAYLNNATYITSKDPPPYPTALQNNQSEATYTVLSSVQPFNMFSNSSTVTSTASAYEPNGFPYLQNFQELDEKVSDLPEQISIDEGIGTSPETSPGQHSQNSPGMAYGDDSMNAAYSNSVPVHPLFEHIQPRCGPAEVCVICGGFSTPRNGQYQCTCNERKKPKQVKRKKKAQNAASSRKIEKIICENCETDQTSLWRRDPAGLPLCNACGLYLKLHGHHRPKHMRKDKIQKRNRKPRNNGTRIPKREPQTPPSDALPAVATVNNTIPYSAPSTSSSVQPRLYFTPTSAAAGPSTSYQLPPFALQNINSPFVIHNNAAFGENNQNTQYSMMQL